MATTKVDPKLNELSIAKKAKTYEGLTRQQLIDAYRIMFSSRRVDDREILLKRQQKIFFQISGAGHEAMGVAAALALKPAYDWFYPYYRDRALCLALGATPYEMLLQPWARPTIPVPVAARCLPTGLTGDQHRYPVFAHGHPDSASGRMRGSRSLSAQSCQCHRRRRVGITANSRMSASAATRSPMSLSAMAPPAKGNSGRRSTPLPTGSCPIVFVVEDNEYAISVPVEVQTAGGNISRLVSGFPNFHFEEVDGTDPVVSYAAMKRAVEHCRAVRVLPWQHT